MKTAVPQETIDAQRRASDPRACAFVRANAGSGKTYVLAVRVVRLLLAGVDPSRLLCLTYTKAAAAEMAARVYDDWLSRWVLMDDAALAETIAGIEGRSPSQSKLRRTRKLFARALETPGGLKIQTIHAFCERLLHTFSLEAGVPGRFRVLDEGQSYVLINQAIAQVLGKLDDDELDIPSGAAADGGDKGDNPLLIRCLSHLIAIAGDFTIERLIRNCVANRSRLQAWLKKAHGHKAYATILQDLHEAFGVASQADAPINEETVINDILSSPHIPLRQWPRIADIFKLGSANDIKRAKIIDTLLMAGSKAECVESLFAIFFIKGGAGTPVKRLMTKALADAHPDVLEAMQAEQQRLEVLRHRLDGVRCAQASAALLTLSKAVIDAYERQKRRQGFLDYDDLIEKTSALLTHPEAPGWVHYKLDQGLDHILVDEAQDTAPAQWDVLYALASEFFAGHGAHDGDRTLFAVGDEKQSIYSFQGAEPDAFDTMRRRFARRAAQAGMPWHDVTLNLSFRSTPDVLAAVDTVFNKPEVYQGLSSEDTYPVHAALRHSAPGFVELWPVIAPDEEPDQEDWLPPKDQPRPSDPATQLAARIADTIADGLNRLKPLPGTEAKPPAPGDFLILVRQRNAFVQSFVRACKARGIPVAGADRLVLSTHIAAMDLTALGRVVLMPEDDLSLACVLKSPLIGLNEEALLDLAHGRKGTLWQALGDKRNAAAYGEAYARLQAWHAMADTVPPYAFYARVLGADQGRARFLARLGPEADEVLDEFLSQALTFGDESIPSLEGFIATLDAHPVTVKRETDMQRDEVRIMTIHGAKGLEARYVFLADTCFEPAGRHNPSLVPVADASHERAPGEPVAWVNRQIGSNRIAPVAAARDRLHRRAIEEERRLLYVAMTRAEDGLYVCGYKSRRRLVEHCWYNLISDALTPTAQAFTTKDAATGWRWHHRQPDTKQPQNPPPQADRKFRSRPKATPELPAWIDQPVPRPAQVSVAATPSATRALLEDTRGVVAEETLFMAKGEEHGGHEGLLRGHIVHRLLEFLPQLAPAERRDAACAFMTGAVPQWSREQQQAVLAQLLPLLDNDALAPLFGAHSRAEVAVCGDVLSADNTRLLVSGRIDRLAVLDDTIFIADYKTNSKVPADVSHVPSAYLSQMAFYRLLLGALYPAKPVRCLIVWTATLTVMPLPDRVLENITKGCRIVGG